MATVHVPPSGVSPLPQHKELPTMRTLCKNHHPYEPRETDEEWIARMVLESECFVIYGDDEDEEMPF